MADQDKAALFAFLNYASEKNLMKKDAAQALKSASRTVFSILDDREQEDIFALDLDEVFRRFGNSPRSREVNPNTMRAYRQRVRQAVEDFKRFKDDPASWKPARPQRQTRATKATPAHDTRTPKEAERKEQSVADPVHPVSVEAIVHRVEAIVHRFPVRRDVIVQISGIPFDITKAEMARMTAYLSNLVVPDVDDSGQTPLMLNPADKEPK